MKKYVGEKDPRISIVNKRLSTVNRIFIVMSPKGGVGKTVFSTIFSLLLAEHGFKTGLLDLDFTNPSTHIVLGINPINYKPVEEKGLIPPNIYNLEYFTIAIYTGDKPLPLRGESVNNIFLELLTIVKWSNLDYLVIDTPPSIRDEHLDLLTFIGDKSELILITTPNPIAISSISRLINLLKESSCKIKGLVENMSSGEYLKQYCIENGIEYLGSIPYDQFFDSKIGDVEKLRQSIIWNSIDEIVKKVTS
ncbi:MAG: P-loop NTPase [Desulfurococcaceae archaeon]